MKTNDVVQSIRNLKSAQHSANPDAQWVAASRTRLLSHIDRTTEVVPTRIFSLTHLWSGLSLIIPQRTVYAVVRPAFIFVLCFGLGTAGWITTVSASLESLPGDALYAVKRATEHTQVAVVEAVQGPKASTELRLSFVSRRVDEVNKAVAGSGIDAKEKKVRVDQAVLNLKTEVQTVSDKLEEVKQENPRAAAQVAAVIDRKVDLIQISLVSVGGTASSTDAVAAIAQLKQDSGIITQANVASMNMASSTTVTSTAATTINTTPTTTTLTTITTTTISMPTHAASSSAPIVERRPAVVKQEVIEQPTVPVKPLLPERPIELSPDVVGGAVPISIQMDE